MSKDSAWISTLSRYKFVQHNWSNTLKIIPRHHSVVSHHPSPLQMWMSVSWSREVVIRSAATLRALSSAPVHKAMSLMQMEPHAMVRGPYTLMCDTSDTLCDTLINNPPNHLGYSFSRWINPSLLAATRQLLTSMSCNMKCAQNCLLLFSQIQHWNACVHVHTIVVIISFCNVDCTLVYLHAIS